MDNLARSKLFLDALYRHCEGKAKLYDGVNSNKPISWHVMICVEELGEVAAEIMRCRPYAAIAECLDLAHTVLLIAINLDKTGEIIKAMNNREELEEALTSEGE